jgi:hypothetical protein
MSSNYSYIIFGRFIKPEKSTGKAGSTLLNSILTVNKRIKKRPLLPFQINYGSEISGLFRTPSDAVAALVYLEEELIQSGLGPVMHWSICRGTFSIMKDEKNNPVIGGKELQLFRQLLEKEKIKKRFFIRLDDREDDFFLLQGLSVWDHLMQGWNLKRDWEILALYLQGNDYKYAADALNIARPQTWRKFRSLQMAAYFNVREILLSGRLLSENLDRSAAPLQITKP